MKKYKGLVKDSRSFILLIVLILITFLGVTAWSSRSFLSSINKRQQNPEENYNQRKENLRQGTIAVENRTKDFEVVSLNKNIDKEIVVLTLRNRYLRPVTGYKFSVGDSIEYA